MKKIGVIPARYNSSRFQGKPLADLNGKPVIWWTYNNVKNSNLLDEVYVATDDKRILDECKKYNIKAVMTSVDNKTPTDRIYEFSNIIEADYYIVINGDEPLVEKKTISKVIPKKENNDDIYVANIITKINNASEVVDFTNLKVVVNESGEGIYISRSPIPYPKGSLDFDYKKHVGVYAFNKKALDFYHNTKRGTLEIIEDIDLLRYIENHIPIKFIEVNCHTLSIDTPKDLIEVKKILKKDKNDCTTNI